MTAARHLISRPGMLRLEKCFLCCRAADGTNISLSRLCRVGKALRVLGPKTPPVFLLLICDMKQVAVQDPVCGIQRHLMVKTCSSSWSCVVPLAEPDQVLVLGRCRYTVDPHGCVFPWNCFLLKCNYLLLGMTAHQVFILNDIIKLEMHMCVLLFVSCQSSLMRCSNKNTFFFSISLAI